MRSRIMRSVLCGLALAAASAVVSIAQTPTPTYQGQLTDGAAFANGTYDFRLQLYADATNGSVIEAVDHFGVTVTDGIFTLPLSFSSAAWGDGGPRWLSISVAKNGVITTLQPRQPITPAPSAINARVAQKLAGFSTIVTTVPDQVIAPTANNGGTNIANGPWQSFTPGISGDLMAVEVRIGAFGRNGGTASARVLAGEGTSGALLGSTTVTVPDSFDGMLRISFNPGITLSAGSLYTVAMDDLNGPNWFYVNGDTYPDGRGAPGAAADYRMNTFMAPTGSVAGWSAAAPFGVGATTPAGDLTVGNYQGGTGISFVGSYAKQLVLSGDYNTPPNSGDAVKLLINDYDNESSDIYPIYVEDENNVVDFFLRAQGMQKTAYIGGSLGIGTKSPASKLHIVTASVGAGWQLRLDNSVAPGTRVAGMRCGDSGFLEATSQADTIGGTFARLSTAGIWTSVSDERLKKDIESADSSKLLDAALALRPVHYRFKTEPSEDCGEPTPTHLGLIAQEVQRVLPEFVADDGKTLTLDYASLSVVALGALQEQQQQLADARSQIESLKGELARAAERDAATQARLDRIEALLRANR